MDKLKQNLLQKYGVGEYLLAALGIIVLYRVGKWFWVVDFNLVEWPEITVVLLFLSLGALLTGRPMAILDLARKTVGLPTKKETEDA